MIISINRSIAPHYVRIRQDNHISFGGNQGWFSGIGDRRAALLKRGGCGLVACVDLLLYYAAKNDLQWTDLPDSFRQDPEHTVSREDYKALLRKLSLFRYPILPFFGSFNWQVPLFLNSYFRHHHAGARVRLLLKNNRKQRKAVIEQSLEKGYPCILLLGPHIFHPKKESGVTFYVQLADGSMAPAATDVSGHFVTVTGLYFPDDASAPMYLEISSWGSRYYIDSEALDTYIRRSSSPLFSSLFYLTENE